MPPFSLPLTTVAFDWDGTLLDSFETTRAASLAVFRHFGIVLEDDEYRRTYRPDWRETYRELGIPEAKWGEADGIWNAAFRSGSAGNRLLPGAGSALDALADAGMRFAIVTTAQRARLDEDLERLALRERFAATVAFEDCRRRKPHPEGLLTALAALGAEPEETLFVGDRPEDVAMGRRAGTRTAALPSGFSGEAMLREAEPDLLLARIVDLPAALSIPVADLARAGTA